MVHSVLDRQHGLLVATKEKSFEETPREVGLDRILTVGRRRELLLVADKDDSLRVEVEWNQTSWLGSLASFIDNEVVD